MSLRQTQFSPVLRSLAAATLLVWIGALVLCQSKCCSGTDHENAAEPAHHHTDAKVHSHDDDSPAPQHHDEPLLCLSLKSLLHSDPGIALSKLAPQSLYALPLFAPTLDGTAPVIHETFRHAKPRAWVFTPEVCLGPAFRSLAPPSLHSA